MNSKLNSLSLAFFLIVSLLIIVNRVRGLNELTSENLNENLNKSFEISIIHINDFHARFEETNVFATGCKKDQNQTCIGGYARAVTVIKNLLRTKRNPIYLNAGDNFTGTLWYSLGRWNVTSHLLNLLKADAMTLGNHEFDNSIEGIVPFLNTIESPIVVSNLDDSEQPEMQGKYKKSVVIEREGRKIGVIGVILQETYLTADVKKLKFLDEIESVKTEAAALKKQGVNIIIVLSHCGLDTDYAIANNAGPYINIIVGGHSHTFMYSGNGSLGPDKAAVEYPAVVSKSDGRKVLIVQASAFMKYVGDIVVQFDENNNIIGWNGAPIFLDSHIPKDEEVLQHLQPWKDHFDQLSSQIVGETNVDLNKKNCFSGECKIGNFLTDAFVYYHRNISSRNFYNPLIGLIVVGDIRASLLKGPIDFGDLSALLPFGQTIDLFELSGRHLLDAFEYSVSKTSPRSTFYASNMLQVSGLKVVFNVTQPIGNRVVSIGILHNDHYEPLEMSKTYHIISSNFLNNGGDGYSMFKQYKKNYTIGPLDTDLMKSYLKETGAINVSYTGRISVLT